MELAQEVFQGSARRVPAHLQRMLARGGSHPHGITRQQLPYSHAHANHLNVVQKMVRFVFYLKIQNQFEEESRPSFM